MFTAERTGNLVTLNPPAPDLATASHAAAHLLQADEHLVQTGPATFLVVQGRNGSIAGRVVDGQSYAVVARDFGISAERVRQLSVAYLTPEIAPIRKERMAARRTAQRKEKAREYAVGKPDATLVEIARVAGVSRPEAAAALGTAAVPRKLRAERPQQYTDAECFAALRRAAGADGQAPVSMAAYNRANADLDAPSDYTLVLRFGSWARACEAAGVRPGATPNRSYTATWSDAELREWVFRFFREVGLDPLPSMPAYTRWAGQQPGRAPSAITLRNRLGRWSDLIREYMAAGE